MVHSVSLSLLNLIWMLFSGIDSAHYGTFANFTQSSIAFWLVNMQIIRGFMQKLKLFTFSNKYIKSTQSLE